MRARKALTTTSQNTMSLCDNLISYVDGELDAPEADAFREHLKTCEDCPARLVEAVQLTAQLSTLRGGVTPETDSAVVPPPVALLPSPQPQPNGGEVSGSARRADGNAGGWHLMRLVAVAA